MGKPLVAIDSSLYVIAAICLLFSSSGTIHSTSALSVRGKTYHETEMRSKEVVLQEREEHEDALLVVNKWRHIARWVPNAPDKRSKQQATAVTIHATVPKSVKNGTKEQLPTEVMMVMFGGTNSSNAYLNNITWMYDYKINSWRNVTVQKHPTVYKGHSLVTLCNDTVVLFGGVNTQKNFSNETWIFQASKQNWTQIFPSTGGNTLWPRAYHSAVTMKSPNATCTCPDSMFVYGGRLYNNTDSSELWELRCQTNSLQWTWLKRNKQHSNYQNWPPPGCNFLAASNQKTSLYLYGLTNSDGDQYKLWNLLLTVSGDVEWTVVFELARNRSPGHTVMDLNLKSLTAQYMTIGKENHYFIVCCPLYAFDFQVMMWKLPQVFYETASQAVPCLRYPSSAAVNDQLVIFGGSSCNAENNIDFNKLWNLTLANTRAWLWEQKEPPLTGPLRGRGGMAADINYKKNKLYVYGGLLMNPYGYDLMLSDSSIWTLDIRERRWGASLMPFSPPPLFGQTGIMLNIGFVVVGGKSESGKNGTLGSKTWIFDDDKNVWVYYYHETVNNRMWHSAARKNSHIMVIFGGLKYEGNQMIALNDTWQLTVHSGSNAEDSTYKWKQLESNSSVLSGRFGHTAVIINNTMIVYGGSTGSSQRGSANYICQSVVWMYDILSKRWENYSGSVKRCLHSAATIGTKMIIVGGCSTIPSSLLTGEQLMTCPDSSSDMLAFTLDATLSKVLKVEYLQVSNWIDGSFLAASLLPWQNGTLSLLGGFPADIPEDGNFYDGTTKAISVIRPGCNPGFVSSNFSLHYCHQCSFRQYPNAARNNCSFCPQGLTIPKGGYPVTGQWNCSHCINSTSYCQNGKCHVVEGENNVRRAYCSCPFGFENIPADSNENEVSVCQPIYLAEEIGAILAIVIVISLIIMAVRVARRHFKQALETREGELRDLANIWVIDSRELKLLERIDSTAPGGFGDVYRAEYREFIVAVKKLQDLQRIDACEREFEREIKFMRTVRHPNIVLFLGGGRFHDDGCPFLVLEYMSRGSLGAILKDDLITITDDQKIRFCLDAAKGMKFLHGLSPPRVHRDLKSNNLLVSKHWVVKVADFGSARLIREDRPLDDTASGEFSQLSDSAPLLGRNSQLSIGVGTTQWSAPELLSGQIYGSPVDVYRYGYTKNA